MKNFTTLQKCYSCNILCQLIMRIDDATSYMQDFIREALMMVFSQIVTGQVRCRHKVNATF